MVMAIMFIVGVIGLAFIALVFVMAAPRVAFAIIGALLLAFGGGCLFVVSSLGSLTPGVLMVVLLPAFVGAFMLIYALTASSRPQDTPDNLDEAA